MSDWMRATRCEATAGGRVSVANGGEGRGMRMSSKERVKARSS